MIHTIAADVSKCDNESCKLKEHCLRWVAKPQGERQAYATFHPNDAVSCDDLIKIKKFLTDEF